MPIKCEACNQQIFSPRTDKRRGLPSSIELKLDLRTYSICTHCVLGMLSTIVGSNGDEIVEWPEEK